MFSKQYVTSFSFCALFTGAQFFSAAQDKPAFFAGALTENRKKLYANTVAGIVKSLSQPLNEANETAWTEAFQSINSLKYKTVFVNIKIDYAAKNTKGRSRDFQSALIDLLNSDYPGKYFTQAKAIFFNAAGDAGLMAKAAHYIMPGTNAAAIGLMKAAVAKELLKIPGDAVLEELVYELQHADEVSKLPSLTPFFAADYLPGQTLVFSFQRKNRDYPGIVIVRNAEGKFLKNTDGSCFYIGQLARSESNMPGYISMGNTPQGVFRMDGFDTSKLYSIGPTTNIQLTMPFEYKASHFFRDSSINDSVYTKERYASLLPAGFKNYHPLYGSYFAGAAGRNEIIAHGTTIDPACFSGKPYFPYSPSAGCLVAKEIWDEKTGFIADSDQLRLSNAIKMAGGANGYLVVIELNNAQRPVGIKDISSYLP